MAHELTLLEAIVRTRDLEHGLLIQVHLIGVEPLRMVVVPSAHQGPARVQDGRSSLTERKVIPNGPGQAHLKWPRPIPVRRQRQEDAPSLDAA